MKQWQKKGFRIVLATAILATITLSASALSGFTYSQFTMDSTMTSDVLLGNDAIHSDESTSTLVGSNVVAAINGGFFNSYYTGTGSSFPDNCPLVYGTVVDQGLLINGGDTSNMIGFTYDGQVLIDQVKMTPVYIRNGYASVSMWNTNQLHTTGDAITMMTDDLDLSYTVPSDVVVMTISNGVVTAINQGGTYTVADGTFHLVFTADAITRCQTWDNYPALGDTIQTTFTVDKTAWESVKSAVTGGRMLVKNSANVTADSSYNAEYDAEAKQNNTDTYLRSFAAIMSDGSTLFGTATGTFPEIANYLISLGAVDAISLDGGGSSYLYSRAQGTITPAGRELATVLAIKDADASEVPPADPVYTEAPSTSTGGNSGPSDWAVATVETMESLGLAPSWMFYGYQSPITREHFCSLILTFVETRTGRSAGEIYSELGNYYADFTFTDTDSYQIRCVAAMGIVNGKGEGTFCPDDYLTREEAATMILRMVNLLGYADQVATPTFADQSAISSWAVDGVAEITGAKIMNGDGTNFNPQGTYTKEEAFQTILNVYNNLILN